VQGLLRGAASSSRKGGLGALPSLVGPPPGLVSLRGARPVVGCRVYGWGFEAWDFRVYDLGFEFQGSRFWVQARLIRVYDFGVRVENSGGVFQESVRKGLGF